MSESQGRGRTSRARGWRRPAAACAVALALAACDGDDSPSLSVAADGTTTVASGAAVVLHATVGGGSAAPTWSLAGPGSLSTASGLAVTYLPPDAEVSDEAGTATITARSGDLAQSIEITLAAANVAGHRWDVARAAQQPWIAVAWSGGLFAVVGARGGIATSSDGATWTHHDAPTGRNWDSVVNGPAGWVAVGVSGNVATSADGSVWSEQVEVLGDGSGERLHRVAAGNGLYVVAGAPSSYASADGATWTPVAQALTSVAFGNGVFSATTSSVETPTSGPMLTSADGVHWTAASAGPDGMSQVAFGNGMFLASDMEFDNAASADGSHWTRFPASLPMRQNALSYADGAFYASSAYGVSATTDGKAWTQLLGYDVGPPAFGPVAAGGGIFVMAVPTGELRSGPGVSSMTRAVPPSAGTLRAADFVDGRYVAVSEDGFALSSTDGRTWTSALFSPVNPAAEEVVARSIAHAPDGTIVAAGMHDISVIGINGRSLALFTSLDGRDWAIWTPAAHHENVAVAVLHDGLRFVALDDGGHVYTSPDGSDWTEPGAIAPLSHLCTALAFGPGRYVAVGLGGVAATSTDGVTWTTAPIVMNGSVPLDLHAVAYDGRGFVAVGANGQVATSADGMAWSVAGTAVSTSLYGIAASSGGELVAVGWHGVVESSADGVTWTQRTPAAWTSFYGVTAIDGGFVAVGEDGLVELSAH